MHVLFVHRAFPAQFGRLALELTQRYGWQCSFLVEHLSNCPPPTSEMLARLRLHQVPASESKALAPWPEGYGRALLRGRAAFEVVRGLHGFCPDLVVGHGGLLPTLFLREVLNCPIVDYCEYFFAPSHCDLTYRVDLPRVQAAAFQPRCINAATLVNLLACDSAYSATQWQRHSFPQRFHHKIEVHYDGVDTTLYQPRAKPTALVSRPLAPDTPVVTFAARGLESIRGFDLFVRLAQEIARRRSDVLFVVAGAEDVHYGWDASFTGGASFKQWALAQLGAEAAQFLFLGQIGPEQLAEVFAASDLHVYLTAPFVLSWSLLDALSCGCVVLAGDVPPVREVISPGKNGLLEPLFDTERMAEVALKVLERPDAYRYLGTAARERVEEKYSLEVTVPELKTYFERVAATH